MAAAAVAAVESSERRLRSAVWSSLVESGEDARTHDREPIAGTGDSRSATTVVRSERAIPNSEVAAARCDL
jgi:hypothetical protein